MRPIKTFFVLLFVCPNVFPQSKALVFQTDFGTKDGAVAAMKGVAYSVSDDIHQFDLTHEIPAYNIWEAAYRLNQAAPYWPAGTVFVSVVDPGVGSNRKSVVMKSKSGHYFVTPDNGTLTFVAASLGIEALREIDETKNRLKDSNQSYTFHGRDVYAFTGAKLAAGVIRFDEVGPLLETEVVELPYQKPKVKNNTIYGNIDVLDIQYGNVWTNIDRQTFDALGVSHGDVLSVQIFNDGKSIYKGRLVYGKTFSDVKKGEPVAYLNSLLKLALGINQGNFSERFRVGNGTGWTITLAR